MIEGFSLLREIFGQRRRVGNRERHIEQSCQSLGKQRLARTGRTDQQDVRFGQFDLVVARTRFQTLVVVVDRDREHLLGAVLANHVLIENVEDLLRLGQVTACRSGLFLKFFTNDVVAELHAFIADEYGRARNQLADFVLALAAERAIKNLSAVARSALSLVCHATPRVVTPDAGRA